MSSVLRLSLRPRKLSQLVGQEKLVHAVRTQVAKRSPQVWMFVGGPGCGKTTVGRIIAVSYQCHHQGEQWGEPCEECWKRRNSLYTEINASEVSGVEELGEIVRLSRQRPMGDDYRIFILDEAQRITSQAQNLLLKPLEEPPSTTIWIICTTDPTKLLPAIKRRPTTYNLRSLGVTDTEKFIESTAKKIGCSRPLDKFTEQIHLAGIGSPGVILQALEKYEAGASAMEAIGGVDRDANSFGICKAVASGKWLEVRKLMADVEIDEGRWIRKSVAGYLKGILQRENDPKKAERAAQSILELCSPPYDEEMLLHWLWGSLHRITRRYRI